MSQRGPPHAATKAFDPSARFVRLRQVRADGFVEFEFAVGEPDLSVELILPLAAFHEFCSANEVTRLASIEDASLTPPDDASAHSCDPKETPCR